MLDLTIEKEAAEFIQAVKDTEIYKEYRLQLERIQGMPELYSQVNDYRQRNFELQNSEEEEGLFEKIEAFEKEYEKFRENPVVDSFLRAELSLCRMMQSINTYIFEEINFDMAGV